MQLITKHISRIAHFFRAVENGSSTESEEYGIGEGALYIVHHVTENTPVALIDNEDYAFS